MKDIFFQDSPCKGVRNQSLAEKRTQFKSIEHRVLSITHMTHLTKKSLHHLLFYAEDLAHSYSREEAYQ